MKKKKVLNEGKEPVSIPAIPNKPVPKPKKASKGNVKKQKSFKV
jgi:hypothetical protein